MAAKTFLKTALTISLFLFVLSASTTAHAKTIYVDDDATGTNDGSSWADAFNFLQDALAAAYNGDEIRVAQGIYRPDQGTGITLGSREATFQLVNGVTLKGGYAGFTELDPNARDVEFYETILTGDLAGNDADILDSEDLFYDLLYDPTRSDNSYNVIIGSDINAETIFDGFTVTGGHADGSNPSGIDRDEYGGGMYNVRSCMTLVNCNFIANFSTYLGGGMYNSSQSRPTLTHCKFSRNSTSHGGGICNNESSPMIVNCTFTGNSVPESGGAIFNHVNANPVIANCTVSGNTARIGGGIRNDHKSIPTITNCFINGNSANYGGGVRCDDNSSPNISNCTFIGNWAKEWGGALLNGRNSSPKISSCTFSGNFALINGHVMSNYYGGGPTLYNCIIWRDFSNLVSQISLREQSSVSISYCNIRDGEASIYAIEESWYHWGQGNMDINPLLESDGYHLKLGSPCINAGDPLGDYAGQSDIDRQSRVMGAHVDIGADEYGTELQPLLFVHPTQLELTAFVGEPNSGSKTLFIYNLTGNPLNWSVVEHCSWLKASKTSGTLIGAFEKITLIADTTSIPRGRYTCNIAVSDGVPDHSPMMVAVTLVLSIEGQLYVPEEFTTVQAAIDVADDGDTVVVDDGTYTGNGNRDIDFRGKAITVRSENGPQNCIIDCQGHTRGFYFHSNEGRNSILEGFTITNGLADGGGVYCRESSPTLTNCKFIANSGRAVRNSNSRPFLIRCMFIQNRGGNLGGAIENYESDSTLIECTFIRNSANRGGGMYNYDSNPMLTDCTFSSNRANGGGGIYNDFHSSPHLVNCIFSGNWADMYGGAIQNWNDSNPTLANCTFTGNSAGNYGGALYSQRVCNPKISNCIMWDNKAPKGGSIYLALYSWAGNTYTTAITVSYTDVERGEPGVYVEPGCKLYWLQGNIDDDPLFVEPGYWDANGTPADANDDVWVDGDYHLLPDSPCINAGNPNYLAEPNETDLDGKPRIIGCRIDMGAYEYGKLVQAEARILPRTINLASKGKWLSCFISPTEDYNVADIDSDSILLECEIKPESLLIDEQSQLATARFAREDVQPILGVGDIDLTITGQLIDEIYFEATDTIKVIDKAAKN